MLEVKNLQKVFKNGEKDLIAINEANFTINKGEVILFIGPSGSGKTTLISMLGGLSRPTAGAIYMNGINITQLGQKELIQFRLKNIGFVFQNFKLLKSLSVLENVMVPLCCIGNHSHKSAVKTSRDLLAMLDMTEYAKYSVGKLSGGQKQRVAIARALVTNPEIILADEPTASLDSKTGKVVANLLKETAKSGNRIVIVVSHDPRLIPIADRIFNVEDGLVKEVNR